MECKGRVQESRVIGKQSRGFSHWRSRRLCSLSRLALRRNDLFLYHTVSTSLIHTQVCNKGPFAHIRYTNRCCYIPVNRTHSEIRTCSANLHTQLLNLSFNIIYIMRTNHITTQIYHPHQADYVQPEFAQSGLFRIPLKSILRFLPDSFAPTAPGDSLFFRCTCRTDNLRVF